MFKELRKPEKLKAAILKTQATINSEKSKNIVRPIFLNQFRVTAGVERQITMSHVYELAHMRKAISDLIRDEQIKVKGCRFANPHVYAILNDVPLRYFCESIIVTTPAVKQNGAKRNFV